MDALKEFPSDGALAVLAQFLESNLEHVSNKSAYLCGVMKTYRQKTRNSGAVNSSGLLNGGGPTGAAAVATAPAIKGPDETKIKAILERSGYTLDVTTGQRKYGGPPPDWEGDPPPNGCEVNAPVLPYAYGLYRLCLTALCLSPSLRYFVVRYLETSTKTSSSPCLRSAGRSGTCVS